MAKLNPFNKLNPSSKYLITLGLVAALVVAAAFAWTWSHDQDCKTMTCPDGRTSVRLQPSSKCYCLVAAK